MTLYLTRETDEALTVRALRGARKLVPDRRGRRTGDAAEASVSQPREISLSELLLLPDFLAAWIRMERVTRRCTGVGWRARRQRPTGGLIAHASTDSQNLGAISFSP